MLLIVSPAVYFMDQARWDFLKVEATVYEASTVVHKHLVYILRDGDNSPKTKQERRNRG